MKRFLIFIGLTLLSSYALAQSLEVIHPYEELDPKKHQSLFEMMEEENRERQEQEEDSLLREYEDTRLNEVEESIPQ